MNSSTKKRIAIIGGGISGLAAAERIVERTPNIEVTVLESSSRLGGVIQTTRQDGYVIEHSADCFLVTDEVPWAGELCKKLNIELMETEPTRRGAAILRSGRLYPVPEGLHLLSVRRLLPLLGSPLLSWSGKLHVIAERFVPPKRDEGDESLAQFTRRRYGQEVLDHIVQPLVSGIYTADPEELSMEAALPQFVQQERKYGSLMKAALHAKHKTDERGARYSLFRSPRDGMQSLISTLETHLRKRGVTSRLDTHVDRIAPDGERWRVECAEEPAETFDGIVIATPIRAIPRLIGHLQPRLADLTSQVQHAGTSIVCMGFHRRQLPQPLTCFGSVIPHIEGRRILAVSHTNVKFPNRAPADHVLLRVFVGGAMQGELAERDDQELLALAVEEVADIMKISGAPGMHKIVRWPETTPQYTLGHSDRVRAIRNQVDGWPNLVIANNALAGVGVPQCIRGGWEAADQIVARLS